MDHQLKKTHTINTAKNSTVDINIVISSRLNSNIEFISESKTLNNLIFSEVLDVPVEQQGLLQAFLKTGFFVLSIDSSSSFIIGGTQ